MTDVASRELRNNTAEVLRRAEAGDEVIITVKGRPVAQLVPVRSRTTRPLTRTEVIELLTRNQADSGLRHDLRELAGETTADLGPLR